MNIVRQVNRPLTTLVLWIVCVTFYACSSRDTIVENNFVGKWKSSRSTTPLFLNENGSWEIKTYEGAVLQYGIWEYKDKKITWVYKVGTKIHRDVNEVLMVKQRQFKLRESDGSLSVFDKLD